MQISLPAKNPFSLNSVVHSHGWIQLVPFLALPDTPGFSYVISLDTGRVVELQVTETPEGVAVQVAGALSSKEHNEIVQKVTWMLGLNQDFSAFYALAREEPRLAHVEAKAQGRILRSATLFEDMVKTILTTNISWKGTVRMVEKIVTAYGAPLPDDAGRCAFPTPAQLAAVEPDELRATTSLGYRTPYVVDLARAVDSGMLDLEALRTMDMPTAELRKELLAIKGIGAYAAASLLMFLGRYDFLPVDSWAKKLVSLEWYAGEPVTPEQVYAAFDSWGSWKALAYWFWDWTHRT